jgi:hypothetical protein
VNSLHFRLRILPPQVIEIIAAYGLRRVLCVWCLWLPLKSLILPCVWSAYGCVACTPHTPLRIARLSGRRARVTKGICGIQIEWME